MNLVRIASRLRGSVTRDGVHQAWDQRFGIPMLRAELLAACLVAASQRPMPSWAKGRRLRMAVGGASDLVGRFSHVADDCRPPPLSMDRHSALRHRSHCCCQPGGVSCLQVTTTRGG